MNMNICRFLAFAETSDVVVFLGKTVSNPKKCLEQHPSEPGSTKTDNYKRYCMAAALCCTGVSGIV